MKVTKGMKSSAPFLQVPSMGRNPIKSNLERTGYFSKISFACCCNKGQQMALMAKVTKFQYFNSPSHSYGLTENVGRYSQNPNMLLQNKYLNTKF